MAEAVVLVGLPGAGKTTYYQTLLAKTHTLVSGDVQGSTKNPVSKTLSPSQSTIRMSRAPQGRCLSAGAERRLPRRVLFFRYAGSQRDRPQQPPQGQEADPPLAILKSAKQLQPAAIEEGFDEPVVIRASPAG